jgi:DNA processing protein
MARALSDKDRLQWLRLARTENVGAATFALLMSRFPSIGAALEAAPRLARRGGRDALQVPNEAEIAREVDALAALGGRFIAAGEAEFPPGLAALDPPPPIIAVMGHTELLRRDVVAIVGARNASALGMKLAKQMAMDLGTADLLVASGMARGIDAAAHEGALKTGTVAVVAGGIDVVYPPENQTLYDSIRREGVIVSEMPLGAAPQARHFPRRNRLISGLSRGVIVIEAAEGSGSLITANYALEQGREVFAVPGSPLDPRAKGANRLIRDGAMLTESAHDVITTLAPILGHAFHEPPPRLTTSPPGEAEAETDADRVRALIEERLGPAPVDVDELIRQCGAPPQAVLTVLLEFELAGRIERHPGNRVSWR